MENKITVIVPAYNVAPWLSRCVDSILSQTHRNLEVILIDDGSADETPEMIDRYAEQDSRVVAVHQKNAGLVAVREKGISLATGEYVGFVDGDDAVDPDMYERLLKNALEADAEISHCGLKVFWPSGKIDLHHGTGRKVVQNSSEALSELLEGIRVDPSLCNKLYKRELLIDSCLDVRIQSGEDLLRNFTLYQRANRIVFEDFCGYQYWSRENSMSNDSKAAKRAHQFLETRKCMMSHANQKIEQDVRKALLSAAVVAANIIVNDGSREADAVRKECRDVLKSNRKQLSQLSKNQQLAARLILLSPSLHQVVYRIYLQRR